FSANHEMSAPPNWSNCAKPWLLDIAWIDGISRGSIGPVLNLAARAERVAILRAEATRSANRAVCASNHRSSARSGLNPELTRSCCQYGLLAATSVMRRLPASLATISIDSTNAFVIDVSL